MWPYPRLEGMAAVAMGFEDAGPATPAEVDVLLDLSGARLCALFDSYLDSTDYGYWS